MLQTGRAAEWQAQVEKVFERLWRTWAAKGPCTAPLMTCVALGACGNERPSHNVYRRAQTSLDGASAGLGIVPVIRRAGR